MQLWYHDHSHRLVKVDSENLFENFDSSLHCHTLDTMDDNGSNHGDNDVQHDPRIRTLREYL